MGGEKEKIVMSVMDNQISDRHRRKKVADEVENILKEVREVSYETKVSVKRTKLPDENSQQLYYGDSDFRCCK
jgi:hypothetical protein